MNASAVSVGEFIDIIAAEISAGVDVAVESWLAQVEKALHDPKLTTLGRMNSVKEVLARYKSLNGKTLLKIRRQAA
jgi:hypothetical protein